MKGGARPGFLSYSVTKKYIPNFQISMECAWISSNTWLCSTVHADIVNLIHHLDGRKNTNEKKRIKKTDRTGQETTRSIAKNLIINLY